MARQRTEILPIPAKLLVQLDNNWLPADFSLPRFTSIQVNQKPWHGSFLGMELDGETLIVRLQIERQQWHRNSRFSIVAHSGEDGRLEAEENNFTVHYGEPLLIELHCQQWSYTPHVAPILWVAPLQQVAEINTPGNLVTYRRHGDGGYNTSRTTLRLETERLAFYILNTKQQDTTKQVLLAFESFDSQAPSSNSVSHELPLLRVLLSVPIKPGVFYGLDADGQTTAALSSSNWQAALPVSNSSMSPVPVSYFDVGGAQSWLASFYRKLHPANFAYDGISPVSFSLTRYGNSLAPLDVDTQFELVAGAVWILANYLSRDNEQSRIKFLQTASNTEGHRVRNSAQEWLRENYGENGEIIGNELWNAVQSFVSGTLTDYTTANPVQSPVLRRFNQVQRLRRAYAVLLSRVIGYQGRVSKFEPVVTHQTDLFEDDAPANEQQPRGWLPATDNGEADAAEANRGFRAEADVTGLSVWPTFELPTLPQDELVQRFAAFAEEVRYQTKGKVTARLRRLPQNSGQAIYLTFRLMVSNAPTTQVALFTMETLKKGFEVQGWSDRPIRVTTPKMLEKFQQSLMYSERFRNEVERLLLIEEDIRRGEA